jgi:hypothetical protein
MLHVLMDELIAAAVPSYATNFFPTTTSASRSGPPPADTSTTAGSPPEAWFIARGVSHELGDGRVYASTEYRSADGTWTTDRTTAQHFTDPPNSLVLELRKHPRPRWHRRSQRFVPSTPDPQTTST